MRTHRVIFYSPGTFFPEESSREIDSWDTRRAVELSKEVVERHNARPHSFRFKTYLTAAPVPDGEGGVLNVEPKEVDASGLYFLGGRLRTLEEVKAENNPKEQILISNMENNCPVAIENRNSWLFTGEFGERDCIVSEAGEVIERGDSPRWLAYRAAWQGQKAARYKELEVRS
jgi:hypothetical protein